MPANLSALAFSRASRSFRWASFLAALAAFASAFLRFFSAFFALDCCGAAAALLFSFLGGP